ncbi:MAG: hypothetical protein AVDCRST_MAG13-2312, partial [uncultured Solirubrobacteraceae bacterium]
WGSWRSSCSSGTAARRIPRRSRSCARPWPTWAPTPPPCGSARWPRTPTRRPPPSSGRRRSASTDATSSRPRTSPPGSPAGSTAAATAASPPPPIPTTCATPCAPRSRSPPH